MDYKARYEEWISNSYFDEDTRAELESIKEDENEIKERFYMDLEFGTAGLRGIIGAGTNRMNIYTVRKATQGLRMIPVICPRNLPKRLHVVWLQTGSKHIYLNRCARRRSYLMR